MTEKQYIKIILVRTTPKTKIYEVRNILSEDLIGYIRYHNHWRKYTFENMGNIIMDSGCMKQIASFLDSRKKK